MNRFLWTAFSACMLVILCRAYFHRTPSIVDCGPVPYFHPEDYIDAEARYDGHRRWEQTSKLWWDCKAQVRQ